MKNIRMNRIPLGVMLAFALLITACLAVLPLSVSAAEATSGLTITGGTAGVDYIYEYDITKNFWKLTVMTETPLTLSGQESRLEIDIANGITANLTFHDLHIAQDTIGFGLMFQVFVPSGSSVPRVNLTLLGNNTITTHQGNAWETYANTTVYGPGTLTVEATSNAIVIPHAPFTVKGGYITAKTISTYDTAAAINSNKDFTLDGGVVRVVGPKGIYTWSSGREIYSNGILIDINNTATIYGDALLEYDLSDEALTYVFAEGASLTVGEGVALPDGMQGDIRNQSVVTMSMSADTLPAGDPLTLTAAVTDAAGNPISVGNVDFYLGTTHLGAATYSEEGVWSLADVDTSDFTGADHTVTAKYQGTPGTDYENRGIGNAQASATLTVHAFDETTGACPCGAVEISEAAFPDAKFRSYIATFDLDGDNRLYPEEIAAVTEINVRNLGVGDLTGVKYFTALETLGVNKGTFTSLDLGGMAKLTTLDSQDCHSLTSLDITGCTSLTILSVNSCSALSTLDVSTNIALFHLDIAYTNISSIDLGNNAALTDFHKDANGLPYEHCGVGYVDMSSFGDITKMTVTQGGTLGADGWLKLDDGEDWVHYTYDTGNVNAVMEVKIYLDSDGQTHTYIDRPVSKDETEHYAQSCSTCRTVNEESFTEHTFADGICACGYACTHGHMLKPQTGLCGTCGKQYALCVMSGMQIKYFDSFADALAQAEAFYTQYPDESTIKLYTNPTVDEPVTLTGGVVTLDLNGKTVTFNSTENACWTLDSAALTVDDSSDEKAGKLVLNYNMSGAADGTVYGGGITLTNASTLTLQNGTLDARNACPMRLLGGSSVIQNGGTVQTGVYVDNGKYTLNDGMLHLPFYSNSGIVDGDYAMELDIRGGTVDCYFQYLIFAADLPASYQITIAGGTFKDDISSGRLRFNPNIDPACVSISGGTFEHGIKSDVTLLADLLAPGYVFYNESGDIITLTEGQTEIAEKVTVDQCTHIDANGNLICEACGLYTIPGAGTEADPFVVATVEQLRPALGIVGIDEIYIKLVADIPNQAGDLISINRGDMPFVLDLNQHKINYMDIFSNGTVKNGKLAYVTIRNGAVLIEGVTSNDMSCSDGVLTVKNSELYNFFTYDTGKIVADNVALSSDSGIYLWSGGSLVLDGVTYTESITAPHYPFEHVDGDDDDCLCDKCGVTVHRDEDANYVCDTCGTIFDAKAFFDPDLWAYMLSNFDEDSDGLLSQTEIASVMSIDLCDVTVVKISGIEHFTNLTEIKCNIDMIWSTMSHDLSISGIDISKVTVESGAVIGDLNGNSVLLIDEGATTVVGTYALFEGGTPIALTLNIPDPHTHTYEDVVWTDFVKTPATCTTGTIYYKSCECSKTNDETFTATDLNPENHSQTDSKLKSNDNGTHNVVHSCCEVVITENVACTSGDCTKQSRCECGYLMEATHAEHDFSGAYLHNDQYHWHQCANCLTTDTQDYHSGQNSGSCTEPILCACGYVVIEARGHSNYGRVFYNETHHYIGCSTCTEPIEGTEVPHSFTVLEHNDDGHWYKCFGCDLTDTETAHTDADSNKLCDVCGDQLPFVEISQVSLTLEGDIGINFYWQFSDHVTSNPTAHFLITLPNGETEEVPVSNDLIRKPAGDTTGNIFYKVTGRVAAKEMAEKIKVELFVDGECIKTALYSVRDYAETVFTHAASNEELVTMMKQMLNYGAASQLLFGHNTADLANSVLDEADKTVADVSELAVTPALVTGSVTGFQDAEFSCILETMTTLRHYFSITEGTVEDYTFTVDGQPVTPLQKEKNGKTVYYVDIANIPAKNLGDAYVFIVQKGSETLTVSASVHSYMSSVLRYKDNTALVKPELVDTVNAMYAYNQAAIAYFTNP